MAIRQEKSFKVYEQATDNSGCGSVVASFKGLNAQAEAEAHAKELAEDNKPTRFYVLEMRTGHYYRSGSLQRRAY